MWLAGMIMPALVYIWPARASGGRSNLVSAGNVNDFSIGTARMAQAEGKPIILIRKDQASYAAFSAICTHLGCIVKWESNSRQIQCPCHAAVFDINGQVVAGPPPTPLQSYEVVVVSGEVMVKL